MKSNSPDESICTEELHRLTKGIKWVWFDLDDTLIDFHTNSRLAHRIIFDECNLGSYYACPETWIEAYEAHNKILWERYSHGEITQDFLRVDRLATPLRPYWQGGEEELAAFSRSLDPIYLHHLAEQTGMIDGAVEFLTFLHAHDYNIGILSNGFKDVQHKKLERTGLSSMIDLTVLSDDIGINKPDPRIYAHALSLSGNNDPDTHIMIGDNTSTDIAGALGSGWRAIHLDPSATQLKFNGIYLQTPLLSLLKAVF